MSTWCVRWSPRRPRWAQPMRLVLQLASGPTLMSYGPTGAKASGGRRSGARNSARLAMRDGEKPCSARSTGSKRPDANSGDQQMLAPTVAVRSVVVFGENRVDLAASVVDDLDDALLLLGGGGVRGLRYGAEQLADSCPQVEMCGVNPVGDLVPRRGHDLLRGFFAGVGQLEQLLAALAFRGDNQPLVDQQLQGRVDRAGARLPQVLAPLGHLLDDFVTVHRSLGEQHKDGGATATTAAAPAVAPASSTAAGRAEAGTEAAGAEATGTEAASETSAEAGPERTVMTGVVVADQAAELTASLPAVLVQCAAVQGCESEARRPRPTRERPAHMGKWVIHGIVLVSGKVAPDALPIRRRYIGSYRYARPDSEPASSSAVCGR